jgi:hypothetical protein
VRIAKYIFGLYFCTALPLSAFSQIHYDHSINEEHAPHICFGENTDCDCATEKHAEESLWEHVFEGGCLKTLSVQIIEPVLSVFIFLPPLDFKPQVIIYYLRQSPDALFTQSIISSAPSRAPPSTYL